MELAGVVVGDQGERAAAMFEVDVSGVEVVSGLRGDGYIYSDHTSLKLASGDKKLFLEPRPSTRQLCPSFVFGSRRIRSTPRPSARFDLFDHSARIPDDPYWRYCTS